MLLVWDERAFDALEPFVSAGDQVVRGWHALATETAFDTLMTIACCDMVTGNAGDRPSSVAKVAPPLYQDGVNRLQVWRDYQISKANP